MEKIILAFKAIKELGFRKIGLFLLYQLSLKTGYQYWVTRKAPPINPRQVDDLIFTPLFNLPSPQEVASILGEAGEAILFKEANTIIDGRYQLFGGEPTPLCFEPPPPLLHWTALTNTNTVELDLLKDESQPRDIKFLWEPCRFGWVFALGRAYHITKDEKYASSFWEYAETFIKKNPPYLGIHWVSGQEVALRLLSLVFGLQVFQNAASTTPEREKRLIESVVAHAARIPPTLVYARAQNNNHLLSEAAGLLTAGLAIPNHPQAQRWRSLGWFWFNKSLQQQIFNDGTYIQQSTNYHRLMLQLSLWVHKIALSHKLFMPEETQTLLAAATRWLFSLIDVESGRAPNLGPNDGAYLFPLSVAPFDDYRPVIQAAAFTFWGITPIEPGVWDEMIAWLGEKKIAPKSGKEVNTDQFFQPHPTVIRSRDKSSWAYLRAAKFFDRPGHADQLHFDLWRRGMNIGQDGGTFLYNAPPPWDNALAHTAIHNTLTVEPSVSQDQMRRADRFLYLDWAQAEIISEEINLFGERESLVVQHDGYRHLGVLHQREVKVSSDNSWLVKDQVIPINIKYTHSEKTYQAALHWLLPDLPWSLNVLDHTRENPLLILSLKSPTGVIVLSISSEQPGGKVSMQTEYQFVRAGKIIEGQGQISPTWGWSSPTYGVKIPALSIRVVVSSGLPIQFRSEWTFP